MDMYDSFASKTLQLIRQRQKRGSTEYARLTELIQLARYREKYGNAAYQELIRNRQNAECEETVKYVQLNLPIG